MKDIKPWLKALQFETVKENKCYELKIGAYKIEIDFDNKKIIYPKLKEIGRETTTNFSSEENFVVLETIVGLLKQGYLPHHISIEKGYKLGHNTKSGNADITVEDNEGNPFLIIEVKTFGQEFEKEWKNTLRDGGQLFSYEKQENKAQVLVLYASEIKSNHISRTYRAITLKDNHDYLATLDKPRGYKDAKGGNDKFDIWGETYQYDYVTNGILEETVEPFKILKEKAKISDLKLITHDEVQKKYNEFATILRKYNIGGRENAFDKLVNLFLAKIVDEQQNQDDLQFSWKGVANDTYFALVDRLQQLYQVGMEKFLNEKVSYVAEKDVEAAFRLKKDAAKDAVLKYFKELKYFSNNDFTFLDVYNEQLFYQNSKVLVEIVQMFQEMKLRTEEQNQFLGDLFEGFLDNGVKQSEG
ncbi:type I restriction enzyme HsdR N-terminal domain-containing protein [Streptococcus sp. sy004]|uniref:type I restriction enzyme HsdR N-terminal domain-containing protein n=1 Tax=Streptococcus sp. sy004 TaxID=2600149 RepID=UPI0011B3D419|nr:type I restriction enzyme HsdR N-terminal domain-containing protein [Streptococcus sp. sy004]TWT12251.1 type I restriction enzyme HsdR N-terminal domain-containing protein [Streptococcus sp. sy004]